MKKIAKRLSAGILLALLLSGNSWADQPTCQYTSGGAPFCSYQGKVTKAYINDQGMVLLYFDQNMDSSAPGSVGISGVSRNFAAAYPVAEDPEFAHMLYASMLSAQAAGKRVTIQMRDTYGGYLKIDRIWVLDN
jgi:hypothetical protein